MIIGIDASRANQEIRSGIENYSLRLLQALAHLDRKTEYRLYLREEPIDEIKRLPPNFKPIVVARTSLSLTLRKALRLPPIWTHQQLKKELDLHPVDVLFVPSHVLPRGYKGKSIVVVHDLAYEIIPGAYTFWQRRYLRWSTRYAIRHAMQLIAVSEKTKEDLIKHYAADDKRIRVLYPGCDRERLYQASAAQIKETLDEYGIEQPYILYVGNIQRKKGLELLIQAFGLYTYRDLRSVWDKQLKKGKQHEDKDDLQKLRASIELIDFSKIKPYCRLLLVGKADKAYQDELEKLITEYYLEKQVRFLGYVPDFKLTCIQRSAALYIQPSYYEGFGMSVVESMNCGVPVIISDAGSLPEIVGEAGLVVNMKEPENLAEALDDLLRDHKRREQMSAAAKERGRKFDWKELAQALSGLFKEIGVTDHKASSTSSSSKRPDKKHKASTNSQPTTSK